MRRGTLFWSKPLGDPFGGTDLANGRHPVKMLEPTPATGLPQEVVYLIIGSLQFSEASLRTYAHPQLLAVAAAVNGEDFVPFTDALFIKEPGKGASVAWASGWHDALGQSDLGPGNSRLSTSWPSSTVALRQTACGSCPGTHKVGHIDITQRVAEAGSERLPDAVPMVCGPGDVVISNRQLLHCSFANTSPDWRVTVNFGFHRRVVRAGGERWRST